MIKCKVAPKECRKDGLCCCLCDMNTACTDVCDDMTDGCEHLYDAGDSLQVFQSSAMAVMQKIADLDKQKKALEAQDAEMRQKLQEAMNKYGINNFENDLLKITYVEPTTKETIDTKKLKADIPEVAAKYTKLGSVKGYVRIVVKDHG